MCKTKGIFKMTKKKAAGCIAALSLLMVPCTALAGSSSQNYVYDGFTVTVGATCNEMSGNGYGRYVDTRKSLALSVTFSYKDYGGKWQYRYGSNSGTTYVSASTGTGSSIDAATRSTTSDLYITGEHFYSTAR